MRNGQQSFFLFELKVFCASLMFGEVIIRVLLQVSAPKFWQFYSEG